MSTRSQSYVAELLWIFIAALVAVAVIAPAYINAGPYTLLWRNFAIVAAAVTVIRLIFFHRSVPWLGSIFMKAAISIATIPVFLFTVLTINEVQNLVDAEGLGAMFTNSEDPDALFWGRYVRNEVLFFGSSLLISLVVLPFTLAVTVWRQVKATNRTKRSQVAR